jgi:hypothetical protein
MENHPKGRPGLDHFTVAEWIIAQMAEIGQVQVQAHSALAARRGRRLIDAGGSAKGDHEIQAIAGQDTAQNGLSKFAAVPKSVASKNGTHVQIVAAA